MFVNKKGNPDSQALRVSAMDQLSAVKPNAPQQGGLVRIPSWTPLDISAAERLDSINDRGQCSYLCYIFFSLLNCHSPKGLWFDLGEERRGEAVGVDIQCLLVVLMELSKWVS